MWIDGDFYCVGKLGFVGGCCGVLRYFGIVWELKFCDIIVFFCCVKYFDGKVLDVLFDECFLF